MSTPEDESIRLPFTLYPYDDYGIAGQIIEQIEAGKLPHDTFFRVASLGHRTAEAYGEPGKYLNFILMVDMLGHVDDPTQMQAETRELLFGELPDAIVDPYSSSNYSAYAMLEPMYYRRIDLANAVHRRRVANGQELPERPFDKRLHNNFQDEWSRCRGIARPIWRLLVKRFHPEWLETPSDYFPSSYIGNFCTLYYISEKSQRRGIVGHAVFSDTLVKSFYDEAVSTGVKGLGKVGIEDLRVLLLDEHPELAKGHELPAV